jgi:hypothetical protein
MADNKITFIYDRRMSAYGIDNFIIGASGKHGFIEGNKYTVKPKNSFGIINRSRPYDFLELRGTVYSISDNTEFTFDDDTYGFVLDTKHWEAFKKMCVEWISILPSTTQSHLN